jgi:hypothetical protein
MKIFVIKSEHSEVPLAEVRTDGRVLDFVVDNTHGKLPELFQNSYEKMIQVVQKSSYMTLEQPKKATVNLLRYVLDNGDVVEITSDGHTALLNGNLLGQEEKDALFVAIKRGEIKVSRKTDIQQAVPVLPSAPPQVSKPVKIQSDSAMMDMVKKEQAAADQAQKLASKKYDQDIEDAQLHEAEDKDWTRKMLYWLKYGDDNG